MSLVLPLVCPSFIRRVLERCIGVLEHCIVQLPICFSSDANEVGLCLIRYFTAMYDELSCALLHVYMHTSEGLGSLSRNYAQHVESCQYDLYL